MSKIWLKRIDELEKELKKVKDENKAFIVRVKSCEDELSTLAEENHSLKLQILNLGEYSNFN